MKRRIFLESTRTSTAARKRRGGRPRSRGPGAETTTHAQKDKPTAPARQDTTNGEAVGRVAPRETVSHARPNTE